MVHGVCYGPLSRVRSGIGAHAGIVPVMPGYWNPSRTALQPRRSRAGTRTGAPRRLPLRRGSAPSFGRPAHAPEIMLCSMAKPLSVHVIQLRRASRDDLVTCRWPLTGILMPKLESRERCRRSYPVSIDMRFRYQGQLQREGAVDQTKASRIECGGMHTVVGPGSGGRLYAHCRSHRYICSNMECASSVVI